ncbi:hypothetical protein CRENBAI_011746, partial [Crenichthys baileyi]
MVVDLRNTPPPYTTLTILNNTVSAVDHFRFLGTTISEDLRWSSHIDTVRMKARRD